MKKAFKKIFIFFGNVIEKFKPELKEEINESAKEAVEKLKIQVENYDYSVKLNAAVEFVMSKIKLPLWLKPFKAVVKNVIKNVAEEIIEELKEKFEKVEIKK